MEICEPIRRAIGSRSQQLLPRLLLPLLGAAPVNTNTNTKYLCDSMSRGGARNGQQKGHARQVRERHKTSGTNASHPDVSARLPLPSILHIAALSLCVG